MESGCAHGHLPRKQSTEVGPPKVIARVEPLDAALGQGNSANESGSSTALGFPSWRAFLLSFGFFKDADSNVAHRPIPAPQSAQVTRLSTVEWLGTTNLLLPHLRHLSGEACVSALIGSGMTLRPFWSVELPQERNAGQVYSQSGLCQGESLRRGHTAAKKPTTVSYTGYAAANRPMKPPSVDHALWQRAD